ncbi:MAG TPA: BON domain-containing protein [Lacipirellulaceae bacterium]|nr:BON domain-containing protein [Lacipirellulaceae bacterium]
MSTLQHSSPAHRAVDDRSNPELRDAVAASLIRSGYAALSFVGCDVRGAKVVLQGSVPSYHLKQMAQAAAQRVAGVARVENRLAVRRSLDPQRSAS